MAFYDELFRLAGRTDTRHIFMCMAHRGRLNLLTGALNFPLAMMFAKMKGHNELPAGTQGLVLDSSLSFMKKKQCLSIVGDFSGIGDVLSHLTSVAELSSASPDRQPLTVPMLPNPSHLEAANPFAVGRTRVEQQRLSDADYRADADAPAKDRVVCLQVPVLRQKAYLVRSSRVSFCNWSRCTATPLWPARASSRRRWRSVRCRTSTSAAASIWWSITKYDSIGYPSAVCFFQRRW